MFETTSQIFASKFLIHKSRHGPTLLSQVSSMSRHAHANQQKERQGQRGQAFLGISCWSVRVARILFWVSNCFFKPIGMIIPNIWKIKHVPNHQSVSYIRTEGFPLPNWIARGPRYQHIKENHGATINKQIFQGYDSFTKVILRIVATSCTSWQLLGTKTL